MNIRIPHPPHTAPVPRETFAPWLKPRSNKVRLVRDWTVYIDGKPFVVPGGYVSDWASVPRLAWTLYPPTLSESRQAAIIHDYFYSHLWPLYERKFADEVLRQVMLHDGARKSTAFVFYWSVRAGRGGGWYAHKKANAHPFWSEQKARMLSGMV